MGTAAATAGVYHRTPLTEPSSTNLPSQLTNSAVRQISANVFGLGAVRFDRRARTITFPGVVNMPQGQVEYAVVHSSGKVHESVFKTDADPLHIHLAALLLGNTIGTNSASVRPGERGLGGAALSLAVRWRIGEAERRVPLENVISNSLTKALMRPGEWIYNGSRVVENTFLAQRDGSIVAIVSDPDALVNNPRPGRDDDEVWWANDRLLPPVGTPVEISLQLPKDP